MLGACSSSPELGESQVSKEDLAIIDEQPVIQEEAELSVPAGVSAKGVVLAALILANGDGVQAVEEGLVSPNEVELALKAIAEGNLQEWVDLAET